MSCALLSLSGLFLLSSSVLANDDVEELLAKMRESYKAVKTAKYTVKSTLKGPDGEVEVKTDFMFKNPNLVFAKITGMPGSSSTEATLKTDGKKVIIEGLVEQKIEEDYELDLISGPIAANLESICFWDWGRQLSTEDGGNMKESSLNLISEEEWNDKKWIVLEETANGPGVFVRYFIDPKTHFIWRSVVKLIEGGDQVQDAQIQTLETDAEVDDSMFEIG